MSLLKTYMSAIRNGEFKVSLSSVHRWDILVSLFKLGTLDFTWLAMMPKTKELMESPLVATGQYQLSSNFLRIILDLFVAAYADEAEIVADQRVYEASDYIEDPYSRSIGRLSKIAIPNRILVKQSLPHSKSQSQWCR